MNPLDDAAIVRLFHEGHTIEGLTRKVHSLTTISRKSGKTADKITLKQARQIVELAIYQSMMRGGSHEPY